VVWTPGMPPKRKVSRRNRYAPICSFQITPSTEEVSNAPWGSATRSRQKADRRVFTDRCKQRAGD